MFSLTEQYNLALLLLTSFYKPLENGNRIVMESLVTIELANTDNSFLEYFLVDLSLLKKGY